MVLYTCYTVMGRRTRSTIDGIVGIPKFRRSIQILFRDRVTFTEFRFVIVIDCRWYVVSTLLAMSSDHPLQYL